MKFTLLALTSVAVSIAGVIALPVSEVSLDPVKTLVLWLTIFQG